MGNMEASGTCPAAGELGRLLLGYMDEAAAEQLEAHLVACPRCLQTAQDLPARDTLVEALRSGSATWEAVRASSDAGLLERLRGWSHTWAETSGPVYDLLAPAQRPGEIGRLGPYPVLALLGAGGMGAVFRGEDQELGRPVAIKVLRPPLARDPGARERFLREARAMAAVRHDRVATIHEVGEQGGVPYLAMELLEGESLEDRLRRDGRLAAADVVRLGRAVAEGLAAVHARGLIHRDVKPGNIWLEAGAEADAGAGLDRVKLLDFGLARAAGDDPAMTRPGAVLGTPAYMAPEQARGEPLDGRCDLFSLGCVLYRAATGEPPFQGPDVLAVLHTLANDTPRPVCERNPGVPPPLARLIERLLAKRPEDRPASSQDVVRAIAAIESGRAPPHGARPGRRRPLRLLAAAALLLALAAPLAYFCGPMVIRVATNKGELVLEVDDRGVEVSVKRQGERPQVHVLDRGSKRELVLQAGDYAIEVKTSDGLEFATSELTLSRGGRRTVRVEQALADGRKPDAPAKADVTVRFTGTIESVDPKLAEMFSVGQQVAGTFTYRPTTRPRAASNIRFAYFDSPTRLSLRLGRYAARLDGVLEVQVDNDPGTPHHDRFFILAWDTQGLKGPAVGGHALRSFGLRLDDSTDTVFRTALALPTHLDLKSFDLRQFGLTFGEPGAPLEVGGTITSLSTR